MSNLNMPVKYCKDENDNEFSPVVYQESMFNDDGTRMDPVPRKMFAKAYDPTKTYPTESLFCINDNKFYKFTGSGTTTGTFDPTKWTETDAAEEFTALNSTLAGLYTDYADKFTIFNSRVTLTSKQAFHYSNRKIELYLAGSIATNMTSGTQAIMTIDPSIVLGASSISGTANVNGFPYFAYVDISGSTCYLNIKHNGVNSGDKFSLFVSWYV